MEILRKFWEIFFISLKLGCTSFGGPTAHLGYFQNEYVQKRKWLSDDDYSQLVALSQFLPGPASSQVGMSIGLLRGGIFGSIVAFLGFTMPSALLLMTFAYYSAYTGLDMGWTHGLKLVAVAIVAQAILDMSKKLIPSIRHFIIASLALVIVLFWVHPLAQVTTIIVASLIGYRFFKKIHQGDDPKETVRPISKTTGGCFLTLFVILLIGLPMASPLIQNEWFTIIEKFYLSGALVFGGGHVVLPLLETQFVQSGLMSSSDFLAGYGMTQAVPGPLFTFASYIGMVIAGVPGAMIATFAIFLPAFLLLVGAMPFWLALNRFAGLRGAMAGANAAVVGLLAAAFIQPIVIQSIQNGLDIVIAFFFLWCLMRWKMSPYLLVLIGVIVGMVFY